MKVVPPGIKFKVNSCKYKFYIYKFKSASGCWRWHKNGKSLSVCASALFLSFSVFLIPRCSSGHGQSCPEEQVGWNKGGLPCTGTVLLCNFKYMLLDTDLCPRIFIQLHALLQSNNTMWWIMWPISTAWKPCSQKRNTEKLHNSPLRTIWNKGCQTSPWFNVWYVY